MTCPFLENDQASQCLVLQSVLFRGRTIKSWGQCGVRLVRSRSLVARMKKENPAKTSPKLLLTMVTLLINQHYFSIKTHFNYFFNLVFHSSKTSFSSWKQLDLYSPAPPPPHYLSLLPMESLPCGPREQKTGAKSTLWFTQMGLGVAVLSRKAEFILLRKQSKLRQLEFPPYCEKEPV